MNIKLGVFFCVICGFTRIVYASSTQPNLQEMRAMRQEQVAEQQKVQQASNFKKQRDDLLANYKALSRTKNDVYAQMKRSQQDYQTAMAKLKNAQQELLNLDRQFQELKKSGSQMDNQQLQAQRKKLEQAQTLITTQINNFSKISQASYENMQNADAQYRSFTLKEQVLKQQIESIQRQLQFILSQP